MQYSTAILQGNKLGLLLVPRSDDSFLSVYYRNIIPVGTYNVLFAEFSAFSGFTIIVDLTQRFNRFFELISKSENS
mgnify:CR=1 FL=1